MQKQWDDERRARVHLELRAGPIGLERIHAMASPTQPVSVQISPVNLEVWNFGRSAFKLEGVQVRWRGVSMDVADQGRIVEPREQCVVSVYREIALILSGAPNNSPLAVVNLSQLQGGSLSVRATVISEGEEEESTAVEVDIAIPSRGGLDPVELKIVDQRLRRAAHASA